MSIFNVTLNQNVADWIVAQSKLTLKMDTRTVTATINGYKMTL